MADFNNLRDQAKQWLSNMFVPKEISPEGIANTGIGATGMALGAATQPGLVPVMVMLDKLLKTNAGKQVQTMLDATGPMGGGLDDIVVAGAKTAPAALGMVAPLVGDLGRLKPRGVPAKPSEWFHSNLAEAVDKAWLAEGNPSDLLNIKQVKAWLNKLPGMGVKKEEIKHFNLAEQLNNIVSQGKMTKQDLADLVDRKMPIIKRFGTKESQYRNFTLPDGQNYQNDLLGSPHILKDDLDTTGELIESPFKDINYSSDSHWPSAPNVLQHIRTTDRVLPDGRKALYAEEVQSDWQQQHPETYPLTQSYEDLAHKYLYRRAADEGYDSVAWTPGSVHIQRWDGGKQPARPIKDVNDLYASSVRDQYLDEIDKFEADNPLIIPRNYMGEMSPEWRQAIEPIQQKYIKLAQEQGLEIPGVDERFSGFESFYNKRMRDSATGMLKRMGGEEVSNTDLVPDLYPTEPVEGILQKYKNEFNPDADFIQPDPVKSFVYNIKPEDKAKPGQDDWSKPMAGKTVPLWMLLSGFALDQLRGDKK